MQLVNMDVDQFRTHQRCQLGPFSPGLNAVCGPKGSGKTTLLTWLRQIAAEDFATNSSAMETSWRRSSNAQQLANPSPLTGRVEFRNGSTNFTASSDRNGRVEYSRHPAARAESSGSFLTPLQRETFGSLAAAAGASDSESVLEELARRLQLDSTYPPQTPVISDERRRLLDREQDLIGRMGDVTRLTSTRSELSNRCTELETELRLAHTAAGRNTASVDMLEQRRLSDRCELIHADLQNTQAELDQIDQQLSKLRSELHLQTGEQPAVDIGSSYREQLQQLDDRLSRWRQTLRDLKSHRERIEYNATDARLDKQIGDQLSSTKHSDPRAALRALEAQILNTRNQLGVLVDRYGQTQPANQLDTNGGYLVRRDASGQTRIVYPAAETAALDYGTLPETLQAMHRDLHEVCQQLARHEATTASETLKEQSQQLQRCEAELLQSVEKLIVERANLLRKIADEQSVSVEQLTLAFGQWCQCQDHPNLHQWLLHGEASPTDAHSSRPQDRQSIIDEIQRLEARRQPMYTRLEDCRRQLAEVELARRNATQLAQPVGRTAVEIARDLDAVSVELRGLDERDGLATELAQVRRRLLELPTEVRRDSTFRPSVDRHIAGLLGPRGQLSLQAAKPGSFQAARRYDPIDGVVVEQPLHATEYHVPDAIVRIAMRLAIVDAMVLRGQPVPLVIDGALDDLPPEVQKTSVAHLASVAGRNQQIIVLTSDEHVASLVRSHHGFVDYIHATKVQPAMDINRQLAAYANDAEADRWYQPTRPSQAPTLPRREYYLNDRSLIEDLPSADPTTAARCRALGIDRIGDLLDVDPHWLADNLRVDGISKAIVTEWQAEARLLCSVRKLLPFDARVLVGAGVRTPQQLSDMHPSRLLDRVERFLATDRGRSILKSGSSYELTRITAWIASAKNGSSRYQRTSLEEHEFDSELDLHPTDARRAGGRSAAYQDYDRDFESARSRSGRSDAQRSNGRSSSQRSRSDGERSGQRNGRSYPTISRVGERSFADRQREEREPREARRSRSRRTRTERPDREYDRRQRADRETVRLAKTEHATEDARLKFYLELSSPVVDAPSIGPRMAGRLEKLGIVSVDQLLAANADSLSDKLNLRRVDASTVRGWQEQARLVCRIPNLRGHDAQLLVACDMTSPEELATMDAEKVLSQVLAVAQSTEGQRILRGSKEPDLEEVKDWISWARSCRSLNAA